MHFKPQLLLGAVLLALAGAAAAKAPADQIERLGKDLTPVGAERAGNKEGTIPEWDGGVTRAPTGYNAANGLSDPFVADKPLFTITGANADQHKDKLAPGQLALLKRYPTYKMDVYPTRRSAAFPNAIYQAVKSEAGK